ncbi:MAG: ferric iron uptake transcriptional regulator [Magnetococcales bacterium]|nr:ferric iron uptake transcriptional regulator [Magnetococcales bacterium]MBF0323073.1 ferric iron uptake transcriptional regulator [Magnetococcales bacterium]
MSKHFDLKKAGLKATLPRMKILTLFMAETGQHLTAEDIFRKLIADDDEVSLATVYRVLTQFVQAGLLTRHHFEGGRAIYEVNHGDHHDHLVCLQCGHVQEFVDEEIEKRQHVIARQYGFEVEDHALHIYVDCLRENCPRKKSSP